MSAKDTKATAKSNRVTVVQVPGETTANAGAKQEVSTATTLADADNPAAGTDQGATGASDGSVGAGETNTAAATAEDLEALRNENEELRAQIAASGRAPGKGHVSKPVRNRADYLTMRAADVDPNTLTKSVLTTDGWVVPPTITQPK